MAPADAPEMPSIAEAPVLEDVMDHAPGEGAVGTAALQREVDAFLGCFGRRRRCRLRPVAGKWVLFASAVIGRLPVCAREGKPVVGVASGKGLSGMYCSRADCDGLTWRL